MQAVERLLARRRPEEITLDEVARLARVGKGTIYLHFRDKDDLFFQTATAGFDDLCALLAREAPPGAPFAEGLLGACRRIGEFMSRRRQLLRLMFGPEGRAFWCREGFRARWQVERRKLVGAVARIIAQGVAEGEVRRDLPPEALAGFLLGLLRARARELADDGQARPGHALVVDLFLHGARPSAARRGRKA